MSILDDHRWSGLKGGYKVTYHPRPALRALALRYNDETIWNPPIPDWIEPHYKAAWQTLFHLALRDLQTEADETIVASASAVVTLHRGMLSLARMVMCTDDERAEMLRSYLGR
ncbi:hypothetical protein [Mesorhizobium sp. B2-3-12]|uniref:hypothetical protein n=1 Tax=Mesorhizobium sp. B2-3-12 TaxID=2589952 RepID=UPI00112CE28E|nr:hypothetical protein [Mesorhizobium sp. B2-3-12]TPL93374.1 hypothetical protein FJ948_05660 [Mesorhizobium sp. B2-3-12]